MNLNSFKTRLGIMFAFLFIFGVIFTITGIVENNAAENAELDFNYMEEYQFRDGMYVKGRVYEIYGEFAVEETQHKTMGITTSTRISSHYYVVPMIGSFEDDTPKYIAVEISHVGMIEEAEKLMEQTWNYYDYNVEPDIWNEFDIQGKVSALDSELLSYFYEWFMYGDENATRADYQDMICPYVIKYHNTSGTGSVFSVILAAIGAVGLTIMIMLHIKGNNPPKNAYNQYSYNNQNTAVPPYSPDAVKDMTDRGFPPPQPVNSTNSQEADDRFGIPSPEPVDSQIASMPSVGGSSDTKVSENIVSNTESTDETTEKDWWSV